MAISSTAVLVKEQQPNTFIEINVVIGNIV
jgi:hypothetical protein